MKGQKRIGVLTGGGDVPGLNPAIRALTIRALREGHQVFGIRYGWDGLIQVNRSKPLEDQDCFFELNETLVNKHRREGGTFLHTSRVNPSKVSRSEVPDFLQDKYTEEKNDLTSEVMANIEFLKLDVLVPIGGDDTLGYADHLHNQGIKVVCIPKTMDNDVPGTDYCLGYSTCLTRTMDFTNQLRTCASSHRRFLVVEVFGRYAGFTALAPAIAGSADRCVIPEYKFNLDKLTELMLYDRNRNPDEYSVLMVSEGAMFEGSEMVFESQNQDSFGHKKLGGIGERVASELKHRSASLNNGRPVDVVSQRLVYMVRSGDPDANDALVSVAYGNIAMDLIRAGEYGRMASLRDGIYGSVPISLVTSSKKLVDVERFYDIERYRPSYTKFRGRSLWVIT